MEKSSRHRLLRFSPSETAIEACATLERAGWKRIAEGDWSWVFAARDIVARVTPWDPAYLLYAEVCLRYSKNVYLPRIEQVSHLASGGYAVFMERLQPADPERATALCRAIGIGNDTGEADWMKSEADTFAFDDDKDLVQLRRILKDALDLGAPRSLFWGGSDIGTGDVMVAPGGQLKLLDPFFIRGQAIVEAILNRRRDLLRSIPNNEIEAFLTLPVLEARHVGAPDLDEMRRVHRGLTADDR